ncbi:MAG: hypothetical protein AAGH15_27620 [Myxococcota bacterium]
MAPRWVRGALLALAAGALHVAVWVVGSLWFRLGMDAEKGPVFERLMRWPGSLLGTLLGLPPGAELALSATAFALAVGGAYYALARWSAGRGPT